MRRFTLAVLLMILSVSSNAQQSSGASSANSDAFNLQPEQGVGAIESDQGRKLRFDEVRASQQASAPPLPAGLIQRWDALALSEQYGAILTELSLYPYSPQADAWLDNQARQGAIPLMWALADRLAASDASKSVFWAYAALIGTWQERSICLDNAVEFAAESFSSRYKRSLAARRANPWITKESSIRALDFHRHLQAQRLYKDPVIWLCRPYSNPQRSKALPLAYDALYWDALRVRARNTIRAKLMLDPSLNEVPPPLPVRPR